MSPPALAKLLDAELAHDPAIGGDGYFLLDGSVTLQGGTRWTVENQTRHQLGRLGGEPGSDAGALRHAKHRDRAHAAVGAQCPGVLDVGGESRSSRGQSEAASIPANDAKCIAQRLGLRIPHVQVERPPVDHQDGRPRAGVPEAQAGVRSRQLPIRLRLRCRLSRRSWAHVHFRISKKCSKQSRLPVSADGRQAHRPGRPSVRIARKRCGLTVAPGAVQDREFAMRNAEEGQGA